MKLEAIGKPFIYRWPGGEVRLEPGRPVALPAERAAKLLALASGRVRQVDTDEPVVIKHAVKSDGRPLSAIHWETGDGRILGPAMPQFLARDGASFWIVTTFEGQFWWINADLLRSPKAFKTKRKPQTVDLIKESK
jgi:hypothetical protein